MESSAKRIAFIEPVVFFILFSFALSDSVITDAIVYKKCILLMEDRNKCSILYTNSSSPDAISLQEKVQPHIATLFILKSSIETFFPIIICLFLGPWSDKNGRKPSIILPFIGSIIYYTLFAVLSNFNVDPYWFLFPATISSLMGGFPAILMICFCYIADVTDTRSRTWRYGFLDFILFGGQLVGFLVNPVLFKQFGYCTVFAMSAFSCMLGLLYSYFFLKETVHTPTGPSFKNILDLALIKELFETVTKKRDGFDRGLIWCCILIIAFHDTMMQGSATIVYLFTKRFGWSMQDFSSYSIVQLVVTMGGMLLLIKAIAPFFKLPDTISIMIASASNGGSSIVKAFATKSWHMYLSIVIGIFNLAPASLIRSIISKTVSEQDLGKANAIVTTMEKLGPFATTSLFVLLHTNFIKVYPCPVWFLSVFISLVIIILAFIIERRLTGLKNKQFTSAVND